MKTRNCGIIVVLALLGASCGGASSPSAPSPTPSPAPAPVPTVSMAGLMAETQAYLRPIIQYTNGVVVRQDLPVRLYGETTFHSDVIPNAANLWQQGSDGVVVFEIVNSESNASSVVKASSELISRAGCAQSRLETVVANVILFAYAEIAQGLKSSCMDRTKDVNVIAHEIGHHLGLVGPPFPGPEGHTAAIHADIMSGSQNLRLSPMLKEAIKWLYTAKQGSRVVD